MKLIRLELYNFASYDHLEFEFSAIGATVISGPTGVGKSTFMDAVPWILFSRTAKNGAADDVLSWNSDEPTKGKLYITAGPLKHAYEVHRTRGRKTKDNDLWFGRCVDLAAGAQPTRGKDLTDTQRLINNLLGFDCDLYLSGAYFHEFSQSASFFVANAKTRRTIIEQVVDLTLAKTLGEKASEYKSQHTKWLDENKIALIKAQSALEQLKKTQEADKIKALTWETNKQEQVAKIQKLSQDFDKNKRKAVKSLTEDFECSYAALHKEVPDIKDDSYFVQLIAELESDVPQPQAPCPTCGVTKQQHSAHSRALRVAEMERQSNRQLIVVKGSLERQLDQMTKAYTKILETETNRPNTYVEQLQALKASVNPFTTETKDLTDLEQEIQVFQSDLNLLKDEISNAETLKDLINQFRTVLTTNTVSDLERLTNDTLNDYFDAEIRVTFQIEQADKLEVTIFKDGNECAYHQLSKGQRQLLKLSYGVATMQTVQNHHGVTFSTAFYDEPTDGCDETIKQKALKLFHSLAVKYSDVFVVDHSESFKSGFNNRLNVTCTNGVSSIEKA